MSSEVKHISDSPAGDHTDMAGSPSEHPHKFLIPSPVPTRRSRTYSASERALSGPTYNGRVKTFCRQQGHGFIIPEEGPHDLIFVHISDIDGEYVPKPGDEVTYKTVTIPPRNEKQQAVHVSIKHLAPGVTHERWDAPVQLSPTSQKSQLID